MSLPTVEPHEHVELTAPQRRVVGALIEKQRTTPADYPLSPNALMRACNQSTSRDPVVDYDQATVERVCAELKGLGLVRFVHQSGRVVTRYRHVLDEALDLDDAQLAVLAVLLLRGPQTVGEVKSRTERLATFGSTDEVVEVLERLRTRVPALAAPAARRAGHKENRWLALMGDDGDSADVAGDEPVADAVRFAPAPDADSDTGSEAPAGTDALSQVASLRTEVAELRRMVESLRAELGVD